MINGDGDRLMENLIPLYTDVPGGAPLLPYGACSPRQGDAGRHSSAATETASYAQLAREVEWLTIAVTHLNTG